MPKIHITEDMVSDVVQEYGCSRSDAKAMIFVQEMRRHQLYGSREYVHLGRVERIMDEALMRRRYTIANWSDHNDIEE